MPTASLSRIAARAVARRSEPTATAPMRIAWPRVGGVGRQVVGARSIASARSGRRTSGMVGLRACGTGGYPKVRLGGCQTRLLQSASQRAGPYP